MHDVPSLPTAPERTNPRMSLAPQAPGQSAVAAVAGPYDLTALAGAPRTFSPHGYVRSDGRNVVVSYSASNRIRELALEGSAWRSYDLTDAAGGAPRGFNPRGYVRGDGVTAVVYLGLSADDSHMHELRLTSSGWKHTDLTAATGVHGFGGLRPYVRHDGRTTVVYGGQDGHIHELALEAPGWRHHDLHLESGAPTNLDALPTPSDTPFGYARSHNSSAVVYRSRDGEIRQLKLTDRWRHNLLTDDPGDPKAQIAGLTAGVRHDGINSIVFGGQDGHLYELALVNGEWQWGAITGDVGPDVSTARGTSITMFRMIRDGRPMTSVVYDNAERHVIEYRFDGAAAVEAG